MERLVNRPTGVGEFEYFLVADGGETIARKIEEETKTMVQRVKGNLTAHLTVASFRAKDQMEETLVRYMQRALSRQHSFKVSLNNYSGVPPQTIYVRVQEYQPFRQLVNELQVINNYITSCGCAPATLVAQPQLTISQQVPKNVYLSTLFDFSQKTFHETFDVNELVLLRRSNVYDALKAVHVFRLQPVPVAPFEPLYN